MNFRNELIESKKDYDISTDEMLEELYEITENREAEKLLFKWFNKNIKEKLDSTDEYLGSLNDKEIEKLYAYIDSNLSWFNESLTEANRALGELVTLGDRLARLTKHNNTTESYILIAKFLGMDEYILELEEMKKERDRVGHNANYDRGYQIYKKLMAKGRKVYGKTTWDKYVYSNT